METSVAGMELTVMGVQVRPFVFFTGQGELMGHVWSGTASEKTPAFQVSLTASYKVQYIQINSYPHWLHPASKISIVPGPF